MKDLIDRQAAIEALESIGSLDTDADREYARGIFNALPSAQPETHDKHTETHACENTCDFERKSNDMISRQDAIDALSYCQTYLFDSRDDDEKISLEDAEYAIEQLPPAQPERKKGKWIPHREISREYIGTVLVNVTYDFWFCDICGYQVKNGQPTYNFCPNCGADMRQKEGSDDNRLNNT